MLALNTELQYKKSQYESLYSMRIKKFFIGQVSCVIGHLSVMWTTPQTVLLCPHRRGAGGVRADIFNLGFVIFPCPTHYRASSVKWWLMGRHALNYDPCDPSKKVTHLTQALTHRPTACSGHTAVATKIDVSYLPDGDNVDTHGYLGPRFGSACRPSWSLL